MLNKAFDKIFNYTSQLSNYMGLGDNGAGREGIESRIDDLFFQSTKGAESLSKYLSYNYFDENNNLFYNDPGYIGFMLEVPGIVGVNEGLVKNLTYFFNNEFPDNAFLHFLLVADHKVSHIIDRWKQGKTYNHPLIQKIINKREEFIKSMATNFSEYDGRIARDYRIYISFCQRTDNSDQVIKFRKNLMHKFASFNLDPRECNANDLISVVRNLMQMEVSPCIEKSSPYNPLNILSQQILEPLRTHTVEKESIINEDTDLVTKCYFAKKLPETFSLSQMIELLGSQENLNLGIPARFVMSYSVASDIGNANTAAIVSKGQRIIEASSQWYSRADRDIQRESSEWQEINDKIKQQTRLLSESFSVMITAPREHIGLSEGNLKSLYNINDFELQNNTNFQLIALLSNMPMQQGIFNSILRYARLKRTVLSQEVVARLPIHNEWKGVSKPGLILHARRGQLINWNPFHKVQNGNFNMLWIGTSGGGKSFGLQELSLNMIASIVQVFVLDIGQSFANLGNLLNGEIIHFDKKANKNSLTLNPFHAFHKDMDPEDKNDFLLYTKKLLSIMCGVQGDPYGDSALEKAINAALIKHNFDLDITRFAKFLEESEIELLRRYGATLYPYTSEGIYGKYFSGKDGATFKKPITVFEFEEIKNDTKLVAIILQILLMEITNQFLTGDRSKEFMIIVDEAWKLLDFSAGFFAEFSRTVRKYGGSLVMCVQNLTDMEKSADHKTIMQNSDWKIIIKQNESGIQAFEESSAFKDMVPLIKSLRLVPNKFSEMLIYSSGIRVVGRLVVDDYSKALYSTDAKDFNYLRNLESQGIGLDKAIEELVRRKNA